MFEDILNQRNLPCQHYEPQEYDLLSQDQRLYGVNSNFAIINQENKYNHLHHLKQSTEQFNQQSPKLQISLKPKKKRVRKYTSNNPNNKKGHWTYDQTLKYHCFLEINAKFFIDSQRRKIDKIFKSMSTFIETRQSHQCRSHHQKIQKKWGSFTNILLNLRLQNFKGTKKILLMQSLQKMGLKNFHIFQDDQLRNEDQIFKKIMEEHNFFENRQQIHICEQNNWNSEIEIGQHKQNCMCLMMSQKYEDQLSI